MDYDHNLKKEIILNIKWTKIHISAVLHMLYKFNKEDKGEYLSITHPMYEIAWDIAGAIKEFYQRAEVEITFEEPHGNKRARGYKVLIDLKTGKQMVIDFKLGDLKAIINYIMSLNREEFLIYLEGTYLSRGRIFLPNSDSLKPAYYQLEMVFSEILLRDAFYERINELNIPIKKTNRRDNYILYLKDSEKISDFVALMGASYSVLELQNLIVERDMRNNINRAVNCNVANIAKSIKASGDQIAAIRKYDKEKGLNSLDEKLKELAYVRLNNPDAALNDLAALLDITKSGINHRMRKLIKIINDEEKN